MNRPLRLLLAPAISLICCCPIAIPQTWDVYPDTWVATDALGRSLPTAAEVGPPRPDRTLGIFYFLWLGAHIQGGPYDVTRILAQDPDAMSRPESPLWGPLHAPHHWGESIFGYYLTQDEGVLRKHAQMLADAGVDVVVFDVTNQITYQADYRALLRVWSDVRAAGNRTPAVAFLTPFWEPAKVVRELWRDLYEPGLFPDLWFRWEGKPLILADPALILDRTGNEQQLLPVLLEPSQTLGQTFTTLEALDQVGGRFPTWNTKGSAMTLSLFRRDPAGERVARQRCENVDDNEWRLLLFDPPLPPGSYYLEMSEPTGRIGWWSHPDDVFSAGVAFANGHSTKGDRTLRLLSAHPETRRLREFFTFRKPQPDYFQGPTGPNQWSWLEVYPQHVFTNTTGQREQMSVGVGQNAVGNRLGSMSEPGARGRSFHRGAPDTRPDAVRWGRNVAEQWTRALAEDPRFIFVTGWNEWIAGRFAEFNGVRLPVMFVDQFDQEHSRDIEPMRGGHGDDYYYQFAGCVRSFKGARSSAPVQPATIVVDGQFADWHAIEPEFRDTRGDPVRRRHRGWDPKVNYENQTGRNDLVMAKVSFDSQRVGFYLRAHAPFIETSDPLWLVLFLDVDGNSTNGWLGYDFRVIAPSRSSERAMLERRDADAWQPLGSIEFHRAGPELELALPWSVLGLDSAPAYFDFKWADHCLVAGDWTDFTLHGDAAPNDRFNYRALLKPR
jgi:hypothetical protein